MIKNLKGEVKALLNDTWVSKRYSAIQTEISYYT
jgi:hypothetical protein